MPTPLTDLDMITQAKLVPLQVTAPRGKTTGDVSEYYFNNLISAALRISDARRQQLSRA